MRLALALSLAATPALAGPETWEGAYRCLQGVTGLSLHLERRASGRVRGHFHFYPLPSNPGIPEGCFEVEGMLGPDGARLRAGAWRTRPDGYVAVSIEGTVEAGVLSGVIVDAPEGCGAVELVRLPAPGPLPAACRASTPVAALGAESR